MGRFVREFTTEASAEIFAAKVGTKVVRSYEWDICRRTVVPIYRVYWTVV